MARETAAAHGRDPDAPEITVQVPADLDEIPELACRGVSRIAVPVSPVAGPATMISTPDDASG